LGKKKFGEKRNGPKKMVKKKVFSPQIEKVKFKGGPFSQRGKKSVKKF